MIIGRGDIASVLRDKENRVFFASGVSNSQEKRESEYQREIDLLMTMDRNRHLVYFGSLSIFYSDSRYAQHKKQIEDLVKATFKHYTIVRLGNISWGKNPNTIINFFYNKLKNKEPIEIRDVHRYIVDKEEFLYWIDMIPDWNAEMNITGQFLTTNQIIEKYVNPRLHS